MELFSQVKHWIIKQARKYADISFLDAKHITATAVGVPSAGASLNSDFTPRLDALLCGQSDSNPSQHSMDSKFGVPVVSIASASSEGSADSLQPLVPFCLIVYWLLFDAQYVCSVEDSARKWIMAGNPSRHTLNCLFHPTLLSELSSKSN